MQEDNMNIPISYSISKVGLPLIVTSSKPKLCFLIDTGATHNIMFSYVYEELPSYFSTLDHSLKMIGIEGTENNVSQVKTNLCFENKEAAVIFSVLEATNAVRQIQQESGIQIHGILGIPFLIQNKWILDFNNLTVQC